MVADGHVVVMNRPIVILLVILSPSWLCTTLWPLVPRVLKLAIECSALEDEAVRLSRKETLDSKAGHRERQGESDPSYYNKNAP